MKTKRTWHIHLGILAFVVPTLLPFVFVVNNSFRTNTEIYHSFFGLPRSVEEWASSTWQVVTGDTDVREGVDAEGEKVRLGPKEAMRYWGGQCLRSYERAWEKLRPYILNTVFVCLVTAGGVFLFGSVTAYVLSRHRFPGNKVIFYYFISTMMFPGVLTLVPSFLLVKELGLLNSYWVLILPYVAGGQVFAVFVFKSFFDGLPEELFECARIDGAGHLHLYLHIVLPLSKPVIAVVLVMNILGTWNQFLWPFIANTDDKYHVIASGLFVLATSETAANFSLLFAAYLLSSIPLLILFVYATKPFIQGMTSGAFKA